MIPSRMVPRQAREAYRLDRSASILAGIYMGAIFPFVGVIARERLHADAFVLSLMAAAPFLGNLFALLWARAMEGRPKLPFMVASQVVARSVFLLAVFATTPLSFALIVSAAQLIATLSTPAYAAVIQEIYPEEQRGRIMSYTRAALLAASVLITFVVGPLLQWVSYRWVFPVAGLVGMASALVFGRVPVGAGIEVAKALKSESAKERPIRVESFVSTFPFRAFALSRFRDKAVSSDGERGSGIGVRETASFLRETLGILRYDAPFRWFAFSVFTYGFGNLMLMPLIPIVQVDQLGISTGSIALLANLSQMVAAVAYFYWGRYIDRYHPVRAVLLNIILNLFIPLCYFAAQNVWYLVPAFVLSGITMAGIDLSYFNTVLSFARGQDATRYQALQSFLVGIRGTLAPFLGGALIRIFRANGWEMRGIFLIGFGFLLLGCFMQVIGARRAVPRARPAAVTPAG